MAVIVAITFAKGYFAGIFNATRRFLCGGVTTQAPE